jgi:hypothetical protein
MIDILYYGLDDRDHVINFYKKFYHRYNKPTTQFSNELSKEYLGKNFSGFIYKHNNNKILVLFDSDDGCGGTALDCKIIKHNLINIYRKYDIHAHLIFKCHHTSLPHFREFYGFKTNVFPFGLMTNNPQNIHNLFDSLPKIEQDIDVLFLGGKFSEHIKPLMWPEHRNINQWYVGCRTKGYNKLLEIKEKNKNYNMVVMEQKVDHKTFCNLLQRAKIYIDLPNIGLSSRAFFEGIVMEKCILALKQHNAPWPLNEWEHYASLGEDYDFDTMEKKITYLLNNPNVIKEIEENTKKIKPCLNHDWLSEYVINTIVEFNNNNYKSNNPISNYF